VNFNVNFNVFLSKYTVHPLVKIKEDFDNIKVHGTTVKIAHLGLILQLS
jgi:extradiol dioxygenase family protein